VRPWLSFCHQFLLTANHLARFKKWYRDGPVEYRVSVKSVNKAVGKCELTLDWKVDALDAAFKTRDINSVLRSGTIAVS